MSKAVLLGKFKVSRTHVEKKASLKLCKETKKNKNKNINNVKLIEPKASKKKEIIEIKVAIKDVEVRYTTEGVEETKH